MSFFRLYYPSVKYVTDSNRLLSTIFQAIASNFKHSIKKEKMHIFISSHQIFISYQIYMISIMANYAIDKSLLKGSTISIRKTSSEVATW